MEGDSDDCNTTQLGLNRQYGGISTPKKGLGVFFCTHFAEMGEVSHHA
jgi:hypothetical protein